MTKSSQAFRTIREVAEWLGVAAHVLRFWESKFPQIKPVKRAGGRRYYRPADMELVGGIKVLLHDRGLTIRGVQRMIREGGISAVTALSPPLDLAPALEGDLAADWAADAEQILPPPQPRAEEAPADEAPPPAPEACMQSALARLAAHVADRASLGPDRRMRFAKALSALHAQMRAQAPA